MRITYFLFAGIIAVLLGALLCGGYKVELNYMSVIFSWTLIQIGLSISLHIIGLLGRGIILGALAYWHIGVFGI